MRAFFCDTYQVPLPEGHRFPMPKYRLLRERLLSEGILAEQELEESGVIDRATLLLAHTPDYLDAVFSGGLGEKEQRVLGFSWSEALVARSRASVFGTVAAARRALVDGVAGNLAGGTHHAFAGSGHGFLRLQRHRGGGAGAAAGGAHRSRGGGRPRRAPGRRHRRHLRGRRQRLHLLHTRREELPLPQAALQPRRGAAGFVRRY